MKFSALFIPLAAAASVAAHGFVSQVTIDGKAFKGPGPNGPKQASIIRQITDPSPIKGANNPAINCGPGAKPASLVADARPGSKLTFSWNGADGSRWPHNTGPMLTYMASCGDVTCDKFDSSKAKWFKIGQVGRKPNGGPWVQADLMAGGVATATIPANLAPGNYLVRHDIIALHLAQSFRGAEFYAGCAQLRVGGNETGRPKPSDLVSLPGAYSDNQPGILVNAFDSRANYQFPGPQVVSLVAGGSNGVGSGNGNTSQPAPTNTSKPKGTGTCKPKNQGARKTASPSGRGSAPSPTPGSKEPSPNLAAVHAGASDESYYPRAISRMMGTHRTAGLRRTH